MLSHYYHAYIDTFTQAKILAAHNGGWRRYLYKGFFYNTIRQTPSTSAGLIMFEILRRKYANGAGEKVIRLDGTPFML